MKYIILETAKGVKLPIIFPECLTHSHVAGAMQLVVETLDPSKDLRPRQCEDLLSRGKAPPVSAGFVRVIEALTSGESESLGVKAAPSDAGRIIFGDPVALMPDGMVMSAMATYMLVGGK